ncbi:MAG: hypothetical protein GY731_14860 [Gammaproteobacteria bacterium]|nr:hypothetical protein [Gammaproteobacteria bacterium]
MTVSAVARGISRLIRLWSEQDPWRLLILLHRESDVWLSRMELPCAVYKLPWLAPDQHDNEEPIKAINWKNRSKILDLKSLMKPAPKKRQTRPKAHF